MKKYILEVQELEKKSTEQASKERSIYPNSNNRAYDGYNGFNSIRVLQVELTEREFNNLKVSVFKVI